MKRIAKNRGRLFRAVASAATSLRRTVTARTAQERAPMSRTFTRSLRASASSSVSLAPAHAAHFDWIAGIIRDGAAQDSFDPELATSSLEAQLFFANLRRALETGYLVTEQGDAGPSQTPVSGYVYTLARSGRAPVPVGFALFKSIGGLGFELWMVGVEARYRGRGFAKALLQAALATPAGMLAHVARVNRAGRDCEAIGKALDAAGYRQAREGSDVRWFVRQDAPESIARLVREGGSRIAGA